MEIRASHRDFSVCLQAEGFTTKEEEILKRAVPFMAQVMGSEKFRFFCLNYNYSLRLCKRRWFRKSCWTERYYSFSSTNKTNTQVYNILMGGKEVLSREDGVDNEADIFLKIDRRNKKGVVGYTNPGTKWQWIYSWFLHSADASSVAGNIAHEWCHKMGFGHDYKSTARRPYSVPYAVGYYVNKESRKNIESFIINNEISLSSGVKYSM